MLGTARLLAVRHGERAIEGVGMRARHDGERGDAITMQVSDSPGDAGAPVVADEVKTPIRIAAGRDQAERIRKEPVEAIARSIPSIGPRAGRIAALARRHG